tara:strand:- start:173 stop:1291 length:1119 start_codon:yes stop_codon:yes gene_type:complete
MGILKDIINTNKYIDLKIKNKKITFYSSNRNDWPHYETFIYDILGITDFKLCYICSDSKDPGLKIKNHNFNSYLVENKYVGNWLLKNIKTDIMFMTTPDLDNHYIFKRSNYNVHYVYIHHSMVSMHSVYNARAFNCFDTIFCSGDHHCNEIKEITKFYNIKEKNIVKFGYNKIDYLSNRKNNYKQNNLIYKRYHLLIAPSWGENCIIENGLIIQIIRKFLNLKYKVTLRPHPQTIKYSLKKVNNIKDLFSRELNFELNDDLLNNSSFFESDFMISDWSGAAFEYSLGLLKPVLFVDTPMKVNNLDFTFMKLKVFEEYMRTIVGEIYDQSKNYEINKIKRITRSEANKFIYTFKNEKNPGIEFLNNYFIDFIV